MGNILTYFWFLGVPFALINAAIWWKRARPLLTAGAFARQELHAFLRGFILLFSLPSIALGIFQLLGGFQTPWEIFCRPQNSVWSLLSLATILVTYVWFLWWLWLANGASALAKLAPLIRLSRSASVIRWGSTVLLLGIVLFFAFAFMTDATQLCEGSRRFRP